MGSACEFWAGGRAGEGAASQHTAPLTASLAPLACSQLRRHSPHTAFSLSLHPSIRPQQSETSPLAKVDPPYTPFSNTTPLVSHAAPMPTDATHTDEPPASIIASTFTPRRGNDVVPNVMQRCSDAAMRAVRQQRQTRGPRRSRSNVPEGCSLTWKRPSSRARSPKRWRHDRGASSSPAPHPADPGVLHADTVLSRCFHCAPVSDQSPCEYGASAPRRLRHCIRSHTDDREDEGTCHGLGVRDGSMPAESLNLNRC